MSIEQQFIDAINAEQGRGHRLAEYVYADWLEDNGDPRGEAWRVLLERGKRPDSYDPRRWYWLWCVECGYKSVEDVIEIRDMDGGHPLRHGKSYYDAMDILATFWVRCHRDPDFLMASETVC